MLLTDIIQISLRGSVHLPTSYPRGASLGKYALATTRYSAPKAGSSIVSLSACTT